MPVFDEFIKNQIPLLFFSFHSFLSFFFSFFLFSFFLKHLKINRKAFNNKYLLFLFSYSYDFNLSNEKRGSLIKNNYQVISY